MNNTFMLVAFASLCPIFNAAAQVVPPGGSSSLRSLPIEARLGVENITLPGSEVMGLVGGSYLLQWSPHWLAGPAVYGAASGHRGGFFVGGAELAYRAELSSNWRVEAGLFAGGGGGGAAPVGGGLMLRPHVDVLTRVGQSWGLQGVWAGVSASSVRFANGNIRSQQAGLVLLLDDQFIYTLPSLAGQPVSTEERGGVGFDRIQLVVGQDQPRAGGQGIGLAGFRLDQWLSPHTYWGIEAAGAAHGGADGYAEVLATLGLDHPIKGTPLSVGARVALGLGGGGAVSTEGGGLAKAGATLSWQLSRDVFVSLEGGAVTAPQGSFRARYAQASLGWELDHPGRGVANGTAASSAWIDGMTWSLALEQVQDAARKDGRHQSLQSVGLQLTRPINDTWYLSGQAHSAFGGGAGAYSTGLVGLGAQTPRLAGGWSGAVELLAGAAGGGGVHTQGGAVVQPMAKLQWRTGTQSRVYIGAGRIRSLSGELNSPVLELAWGLAFGVPTR